MCLAVFLKKYKNQFLSFSVFFFFLLFSHCFFLSFLSLLVMTHFLPKPNNPPDFLGGALGVARLDAGGAGREAVGAEVAMGASGAAEKEAPAVAPAALRISLVEAFSAASRGVMPSGPLTERSTPREARYWTTLSWLA